MSKTIQCDIVSAHEEIFSGEAAMIFATGAVGELGITPRHAPLVTQLKPGPVRVQTPDGEEEFFFANLSTLSKEMAQGSGTAVAALSDKFGCASSVQPQVILSWQTHYGSIFRAPGAMAQLDIAKSIISSNKSLAPSCSYLF